ncbi:protein-L-isoaspartate O-methyltransferase [Novosphingobium sp. Chol11]|uniref:protein-L-isoaspartate O-methyltransferase family protein n=1 Tax=Novosphingobium sp. Chol11 TaxID=1385763 RepID=UPI0025DA1493|nr:protein-L-isoaspartate O-methyltransferase [Novosphingobium sp. Chol11]
MTDRHAPDIATTEAPMDTARRAMVDSQLRVSGVTDPDVVAAFLAVAREDFVPAARRSVAYADRAVPLDNGTMLAPALAYGQMLMAAAIAKTERVLVIGSPGAYLAALAGALGAHVTRCDPQDDLGAGGPYTLVLIDGAIEEVPANLPAALADHGRLVTGWIERGVARLATGRKVAGQIALTSVGEADFALHPAFAARRQWSF